MEFDLSGTDLFAISSTEVDQLKLFAAFPPSESFSVTSLSEQTHPEQNKKSAKSKEKDVLERPAKRTRQKNSKTSSDPSNKNPAKGSPKAAARKSKSAVRSYTDSPHSDPPHQQDLTPITNQITSTRVPKKRGPKRRTGCDRYWWNDPSITAQKVKKSSKVEKPPCGSSPSSAPSPADILLLDCLSSGKHPRHHPKKVFSYVIDMATAQPLGFIEDEKMGINDSLVGTNEEFGQRIEMTKRYIETETGVHFNNQY